MSLCCHNKSNGYETKNCFITTRKHYKLNSGRLSGKVAKNLPDNAGDTGETGSIPISRRSPGEGYGNPLQYSGLEKSHGQTSLAGYTP